MRLLDRWRIDLRRPEAPTRREELLFLVVSSALILAVAQLSDPGRGWELAVQGIAATAFVVRGLWTRLWSELFALAVVVPVGVSIGDAGNLEIGFFFVVVMVLYTSWHLGSTTRAAVILAVAVLVPIVVSMRLGGDINWTPWAAANVFTFVLGRNLRRQRLLIDQLEATRTALADAAVADERRRIARELHDLAGHTLAAVVLHVTGARHVLRRDLDEAERALLDAEQVGRSSLDQIRAAVTALRTTEAGTDAPLAGAGDVNELVAEYRRAGLTVRTHITAAASMVNGPVGTALHRITRESLANVARHAPDNRVDVDLETTTAGQVRLVVADHGRRPAASPRDPQSFGLMGMRERARSLGGELTAGPTDDGWRVEATLPVAMLPGGDR